jgi:hypothetical protein
MGTEAELQLFLDHLNSFHNTIKFTSNVSSDTISFLDISISIKDGYLTTDLYTKPTDAHAYLHKSSCHPSHVTKNIPYSQFLRLRRLCSDEATFQRRCDDMTTNFLQRGYNKKPLQEARRRASQVPRHTALEYKPRAKQTRVPVVVTHNPANPPLRAWFQELQPILRSSVRMHAVMPAPPVLAEKACRSLRSLLMPSTLPAAVHEAPGCCSCGRPTTRCAVCRHHLVTSTTFKSSQTGEVFHIRHRLTCDSTNIIYLLFCNICRHTQYVGETMATLRERFYQHRSDIARNSEAKRTLVTQHFHQPGHTQDNVKVIVIEQVFVRTKEARRAREHFWQLKLQTLAPFGLNTLESN